MGASAADPNEKEVTLTRRCHRCGEEADSSVWYARTESGEEAPQRVYTCPECYFDLGEDERATYYRERV